MCNRKINDIINGWDKEIVAEISPLFRSAYAYPRKRVKSIDYIFRIWKKDRSALSRYIYF